MSSEKGIEGRTSRLQATPGSRLGDNRTPLAGVPATAEVLLAAGVKVNRKRRDGATPLSIAREKGHVELAEKLERLSHAA